jgi:hypothetical protein
MRDEAHFNKARHYIEWNPVKAGLAGTPEQWPFSSGNPKWQWTTGDDLTRYHGAELIHETKAAIGARMSTSAPWSLDIFRWTRSPGSRRSWGQWTRFVSRVARFRATISAWCAL